MVRKSQVIFIYSINEEYKDGIRYFETCWRQSIFVFLRKTVKSSRCRTEVQENLSSAPRTKDQGYSVLDPRPTLTYIKTESLKFDRPGYYGLRTIRAQNDLQFNSCEILDTEVNHFWPRLAKSGSTWKCECPPNARRLEYYIRCFLKTAARLLTLPTRTMAEYITDRDFVALVVI